MSAKGKSIIVGVTGASHVSRIITATIALHTLCNFSHGQALPAKQEQANQFVIGRHTFFDFGPPFDYYDIFIVILVGSGARIVRISLTPPGAECITPAKVEVASAYMGESPLSLLGNLSPCSISKRSLQREAKRCKDCLVFSGANVVMQLQCGGHTRLIRADILDRDWFERSPNTPKHTSAVMQLLVRLDEAVGPGVMEKTMFEISESAKSSNIDFGPEIRKALSEGQYDSMFAKAQHKPSELLRAAQVRPPPPIVGLLESAPFLPDTFVLPDYPPLARLARVEGTVSFTAEIGADQRVRAIRFESGHPLFRATVEHASQKWSFPEAASGAQVRMIINFATNCAKRENQYSPTVREQ